jgi:hypothetical protein
MIVAYKISPKRIVIYGIGRDDTVKLRNIISLCLWRTEGAPWECAAPSDLPPSRPPILIRSPNKERNEGATPKGPSYTSLDPRRSAQRQF